ncbi:ubiquitin-conjugating enzyme E2-binding protein [Neohortaea acidophila]|uniref:Ubiquitin-conjugating enzyme E2-binding protein n=1 Tax=Neohortaea acidophila TaxID=245834 RepID=A0A6A6PL31_9PEZI|nr:ubiquitin-conjugating enzyme E2-binding protein [Neohortaea acidophila]KAF2480401.1 ubiquitin-conjugating enzyme E2-binding protein [Neohortaea acidophila]
MIHLYTEHLKNIRTLSIQAYLSTPSNDTTKVSIDGSSSILTLTHDGESASVHLPVTLHNASAVLPIPKNPAKELHFRVPVEGVGSQVNGNASHSLEDANFVPWTGDVLTDETEIRCQCCASVIIPRGRVTQWKDLPSDGWAEMMDFWHCHKPDEPHSHDHAHSSKGYAAGSQLALQPGVGMVAVMSFLLTPQDCDNIELLPQSDQAAEDYSTICCAHCHTSLGQTRASTQGYELRKPQLSLSPSPDGPFATYDRQQWFACQLLNAVDTQGVRKFTAYESTSSPESPALKLWLFAADLDITSSFKPTVQPIRVAKILWQDCENSIGATEKLTGSVLSEGEIKFQASELALLRHALEESGALLPPAARTFQRWKVGLLEKFVPARI